METMFSMDPIAPIQLSSNKIVHNPATSLNTCESPEWVQISKHFISLCHSSNYSHGHQVKIQLYIILKLEYKITK